MIQDPLYEGRAWTCQAFFAAVQAGTRTFSGEDLCCRSFRSPACSCRTGHSEARVFSDMSLKD